MTVSDIIFCILYGLLIGSPIFANAKWINGWNRPLIMGFYAVFAFCLIYFWREFLL